MTLKNTYLEPRYVLLLPETRDGHERRLLEKGVYTIDQVQLTLDRAEFYAQFNGQHPGYFDTTVSAGMILYILLPVVSFVRCFFYILFQCFYYVKYEYVRYSRSLRSFHVVSRSFNILNCGDTIYRTQAGVR